VFRYSSNSAKFRKKIFLRIWNTTQQFYTTFRLDFLTEQQAVLRKTFTLPPPPKKKNMQQTFVLRTQKSAPKSRSKKVGKKGSKKVGKKHAKKAHCHIHNTHANHQKNTSLSIFPNLSCCCLETGLKPILFVS